MSPDFKTIWQDLDLTAAPVRIDRVAGGSIHASYRVDTTDGKSWFIKCNRGDQLANFQAEAEGLRALAGCPRLSVPSVLASACIGDEAYLVLEWLEIKSLGGHARLGEALAELHRMEGPCFGWAHDNFIGATPQPNAQTRDWVGFWRQRIAFQLDLALHRRAPPKLLLQGERLLDGLPVLLGGHKPPASLLHGDLWSGNAGSTADGEPVVFDPACYYGDRETDLAMTELFGGFGADFYAAYRATWPLDPGYSVRRDVYNLYHVLNHFNLFGGHYGGQAEHMVERLLAEI